MLTVRIPELGELTVQLDTLTYDKGLFTLKCDHDRTITCSRISWQEDYVYEYGWVHVVSHTVNGVTTPCDYLTSIG